MFSFLFCFFSFKNLNKMDGVNLFKTKTYLLLLKQAAVSRCPYCPYANNRRDGVTGHVRSHANNKGAAYSCKYCQYNVPQVHRLKEHLKLHFAPIKFMKPEAYMKVKFYIFCLNGVYVICFMENICGFFMFGKLNMMAQRCHYN